MKKPIKIKRVKHTTAHPGFEAVAEKVAKEPGYDMQEAEAAIASSSRGASAKAKAMNPRLKRVNK